MSLESQAGWWLRADAAISWMLALPGLVDPAGVATFFGVEEPTCSFLVRLWSGFLFMFGWVAWEASRNVRARATLLKYLWIGKAIIVVTVLVGHLGGEVAPSLMGVILLTKLPWIPCLLLCFDVSLRKAGSEGRPIPGGA
jgi:hypothetical protein